MREYKFGSMTEHYDEWILKTIPETTLSAIERYVQRGIPTGGFLQAVIRHDLFEAVGRADDGNLHALREIVMLFYNYTPDSCHGSAERYQAWIERCGLLNEPV